MTPSELADRILEEWYAHPRPTPYTKPTTVDPAQVVRNRIALLLADPEWGSE